MTNTPAHRTPKRAVLVAPNRRWADAAAPYRALAAGLRACGLRVDVVAQGPWSPGEPDADVALVWNGAKAVGRRLVQKFRAIGRAVIIMEHGFFDRGNYTQLDHAGFNHTASWRRLLTTPAPAGGAARLRKVWPHRLRAVSARGGYVLVLGQVTGDAQLADSEVRGSRPLLDAVTAAVPAGVQVRFRAHPKAPRPYYSAKSRRAGTKHESDLPASAVAAEGTLAEAVAGAAFVVTINSNAGNEALAAGCPVLCLGPALYAMAGVARQTTVADMPAAIRDMLAGWTPESAAVRNYLRWLACRQWSRAELADGDALGPILALAMERTHEL